MEKPKWATPVKVAQPDAGSRIKGSLNVPNPATKISQLFITDEAGKNARAASSDDAQTPG